MEAQTVDEYIRGLPPEQAEVASALRALVREVAPEAKESIQWAQLVYEDNGPMIYIKAHKEHVDFGFWRGAELPDPEGLLEGEGEKEMKYVEFTSVEDIKRKELAYKYFVKVAIRLNREKGDPTKGRDK